MTAISGFRLVPACNGTGKHNCGQSRLELCTVRLYMVHNTYMFSSGYGMLYGICLVQNFAVAWWFNASDRLIPSALPAVSFLDGRKRHCCVGSVCMTFIMVIKNSKLLYIGDVTNGILILKTVSKPYRMPDQRCTAHSSCSDEQCQSCTAVAIHHRLLLSGGRSSPLPTSQYRH